MGGKATVIITFNAEVLRQIQSGICPYCEREGFRFTINHIVQKHHITATELRATFGINYHEPLCTPELSEMFALLPQSKNKQKLKRLHQYSLNQPKHRKGYAAQGRINHLKWLLSEEKLKLSNTCLHTPETNAKRKLACQTLYLKRERLPNEIKKGER